MTVQSKRKIFDGRYEILSIVGRGAASVVYHARHVTAPGSEVALKVLLNPKDGSSLRDSLRKEALAMVSARSRYVVRLDDFHSVGDLSYLSMEFAPESDLRKYSQKIGGKLGPEQAELFLLQSAEALSVTHQAGIVHRDIKPDNILVLSDSEVRLADFGIAVLPGDTGKLEDLQRGVGTMNYLAPEVLEGVTYDRRSDIYALGVVFYEVISGQHPFEKAPLVEQVDIRKDGAFPHLKSLVPTLPAYLANAIMQAMAFDAAQRFQSARELIQTLLVNKDGGIAPEQQPEAKKPSVETKPAEPKPELKVTTAPTGTALSAKTATVAETPEQKPRPAQSQPPLSPAKESHDQANDEVEEEYQNKPAAKSQNNVVEMPLSRDKNRSAQSNDQELIADESDPDTSSPGRKKTALVDKEMIDRFRKAKEGVEMPNKTAKPEKRAKEPPKTKPEEVMQPRSTSKKPIIVAAAAILLALFLMQGKITGMLSGLFHSGSPSKNELVKNGAETKIDANDTETKQASGDSNSASAEGQINLAGLPAGTYAGNIDNFLPGVKSPLVLISSGKSVTVIVGVPGWLPVRLPVSEDGQQPETKIALRSNGVMLVISGQGDNGALTGEFRNVLTGDKGTWSANAVGGNAS
jgi:serine/threonine protein kinase